MKINDPDHAGRVGYERQGTSYDPGAAGYELQGRDSAPSRIALADQVLESKREKPIPSVGSGIIVGYRRPGGRLSISPRPFEHATRELAIDEAKRLAEAHPGRQFVVLVAIETYLDDKVT